MSSLKHQGPVVRSPNCLMSEIASKCFRTFKNIYKEGYDHVVLCQKKKCVGYVQKRQHFKKTEKGRLGGEGKLTDIMINKMQIYYEFTIKSNTTNLEAMKNVLATLFHCAFK